LTLSDPELRGLATGESVVAFVERMTVTEGDEIDLEPGGRLPSDLLKPAYRRWADAGPPPGRWTGVVESVDPAVILDPVAGSSRHLLMVAPEDGDLVLLRVYGAAGPVLGDDAFSARRRSVEGALRQ
jgi:hypothetical protein